MFVRKKKSTKSDQTAIQIVENRRDGSKIKQKVLRHVGTAKHTREIKGLVELAEEIMQRMLHESSPLFRHLSFKTAERQRNEDFEDVNLKSLEGDKSFNCGIHDVFGKLYDDLGFTKLFKGRTAELNNRILKNCVLVPLAAPTSKRKATKTLATEFGVRMHVDKIYRMMDELDSDSVKRTIRNSTPSILRNKVNILFYDVTTLYFESFTPDELRSFGFSKDCKFKETQVVIALITTTEGLPITYEAFPGNTHEIQTLLPVIKKLQAEFDVTAVEFAADRGMFSAANLAELKKAGINYVVGAKLRGMDKADNDAAWDGISGYITNSTKPVGEVISNYKRLWEIEDAFRLCKHDLKMRPIFHRKGDRIKAHLDICFITYALGRQLMYRYRLHQGERASYDVLRAALAETEFSLLRHIKSGELYGVLCQLPP